MYTYLYTDVHIYMDLYIHLDNTLLLVLERLVHKTVTICVHGLTELCPLSKDNDMHEIDQNRNPAQ